MVYGKLIWELEAFAWHKQLVGFVLHRLVELAALALQELKGQVAESMASAISEFVGKAGAASDGAVVFQQQTMYPLVMSK